MNIIDKLFTRNTVMFGGLGLSAAVALLQGHHAIAILAAIAAAYDVPRVIAAMKNLFGGFCEVPAWPRFVTLGVAILLAAGSRDWFVIIFLLTAMDGNFFDALY